MGDTLFFSGPVQDAVNIAVQDNKHLVAFITDEQEESTTWETDFLADESLQTVLREQSVTLRLIAGSQDAGFLASLFPVPRNPTVMVIYRGELKEYIPPGTDKEAFISRLDKVFSSQSVPLSQQDSSDSITTPEEEETSPESPMDESASSQMGTYRAAAAARQEEQDRDAGEQAHQAEETEMQAQPAAGIEAHRAAVATGQAQIEANLETHRATVAANQSTPQAEEASRQAHRATVAASQSALQAQQDQRAGIIEQSRLAREEGAKRRKKAQEEAERKKNNPEQRKPVSASQQDHRDKIRKEKLQKAQERKETLAQIEGARADRRREEEAKRMNRVEMKRVVAEADAAEAEETRKGKRVWGVVGDDGVTCALQVRMPVHDGMTVRARFGGGSTVGRDVRGWVDGKFVEAVGKVPPYTLKIVLTPLPNRNIEREEEGKTIVELGMRPSATLIVVPAVGVGGGGGLLGMGAIAQDGGVSGWVWGVLMMVLGFPMVVVRFLLGMLRGGGGVEAPEERIALDRRGASGGSDGGEKNTSEAQAGDKGKGKATGVDVGDNGVAAERRKKREQYYNGNSTAFEAPPQDDEDN